MEVSASFFLSFSSLQIHHRGERSSLLQTIQNPAQRRPSNQQSVGSARSAHSHQTRQSDSISRHRARIRSHSLLHGVLQSRDDRSSPSRLVSVAGGESTNVAVSRLLDRRHVDGGQRHHSHQRRLRLLPGESCANLPQTVVIGPVLFAQERDHSPRHSQREHLFQRFDETIDQTGRREFRLRFQIHEETIDVDRHG